MLSSSRPDGMGPDGMGDHMGDHIMEGPGNFVELSYNIYIDGSPRWWEA